jgi:hypothetical protein
MYRLIQLCLMIVFVVGTISISAQQDRFITEGDRRSDIYTIYSLMMTNPATSHGSDNNEVYLIAEMTQAGYPPEPCVRVPQEHERAYREILDEYNRHKDKPVKLERAFNITKPYQLLNADEVRQFVEIHSLRRTPYANPNELFQKTTDLFHVGDVYFDQSHTLALTSVSTYCGSTCGSSMWKIFEKTSDMRWEERPWVSCRTIA